MFESTPSKTIKEARRITNSKKNKEKISFVIISPCLGYKIKFNKKAPILYYGLKPVVQYYAEEIKANFINSEVFLVAGEFANVYKSIQKDFGIIENQLYSVTGECEQLRLGLQACSNKKIVILKEKSFINVNLLVDKHDQYVYISNECDGPGCIVNKNTVENISYGIDTNKFNGCFMIQDETIQKMFDYVSHEHNKSKMLHEIINQFITTGFKAVK